MSFSKKALKLAQAKAESVAKKYPKNIVWVRSSIGFKKNI